jgi:hypothetical protein
MVRRLGTLLSLAAALAPVGSASADTSGYRTSSGETIRVTGFPEVAPAYAEFLASLPHGPELSRLSVAIVTPEEVPAWCATGMSACYVPRESLLVAPGPDLDGPLLAHEYGHHIAANRRAPGFSSLLMGPPNWASVEHVCAQLRDQRIGLSWSAEPAEAWADVYARLTYPELPWRLTEELRPPESAYAAALADVLNPWRGPRTITFHGRFGESSRARTFRIPLRLDGEIEIEREAERAARLDLRGAVGRRRSHVSGDRTLRFTACRAAREAATVTVLRRSGTGPFTLTVRYPG